LHSFLDGELRQVGLNAEIGPRAAIAAPACGQDPEDQLAVTIWNADGIIAHDSPTDIDIPRESRVGCTDLKAMGYR
jgi:two-component system OmpR family sensor kinase